MMMHSLILISQIHCPFFFPTTLFAFENRFTAFPHHLYAVMDLTNEKTYTMVVYV